MNSKLLQLPPLRFPESEKAGIEPRTNVPYYELVSQPALRSKDESDQNVLFCRKHSPLVARSYVDGPNSY